MGYNYLDRSGLVIPIVNSSTLSQQKIMNSHKISLAIATVVTIISGTTLPSHADRSCPLGFTSGEVGCQKVLNAIIQNTCANGKFNNIRVGRDTCEINSVVGNSNNPIYSVADPRAKRNAVEKLTKEVEKLTREIDTGFTNPGTPSKQRKVVTTSEKLLIDYDSPTKQDYTEITFNIIILPNLP
jgi:hypothetical protein